jgi:F-type H+-transporting ATPase subunit b
MWDFGLNDATTGASIWATIALVIFIGLVLYLGIHKAIAKMLDDRIKKIEVDLAEAEQLRKEAKALLDDYARRREEAEKEAQSIVDAAREEAFRLTAEAKESLEAMVARREKAVNDKIAQAEAQAVAEVRARSADLAVEAARVVLTRQMATKGDALVEQSIKDVAAKLN